MEDTHLGCGDNVTDSHCASSEEDLHTVLRKIQLPVSVIMLMLSITANVAMLFGLKRTETKIFTAILLFWVSIADISVSVLNHGLVLINIIAQTALSGGILCIMIGFLCAIIHIAQTVLLLILSIVRYLAVVRPCVSRESNLFGAGKVAVVFSLILAVCAAALPFLSSPAYSYVTVLLRSEMAGSWASYATATIFIVIPTLITCCLAAVTIWKIRKHRWLDLGWAQRASKIKMPKLKIQSALQEIRASRGIAIVILVCGIISSVCDANRIVAATLHPAVSDILIFISANLHYTCPVLRPCLIMGTSPVLRKIIINWILSNPEHPPDTPSPSSNFKIIQQGVLAAPTPPLHQGYPIFTRKHGVRIHVQNDQDADMGSPPAGSANIRRLSSVSTITCEVFCDRDKDGCTISICGDCEITGSRGSLNKQNSEGADSVFVQIGSSFGDQNMMTVSSCSLSDFSAETVASNSVPVVPGPFKKKIGGQRQSTVSLNSLSPLDARYISAMDTKGYDRKAFTTSSGSSEVKMAAKRTRVSLPVSGLSRVSSLPPIPRIAFLNDAEKGKDDNSGVTIKK